MSHRMLLFAVVGLLAGTMPGLAGNIYKVVTPTAFEVGRHLIEGLENPTVVQDTKALAVLPIRPMRIREAIQKALAITKA